VWHVPLDQSLSRAKSRDPGQALGRAKDTKCCTLFMEELSLAREKYQFRLWTYVLMPNHVHLLICPYQSNYNTSVILQDIEGKTSARYRKFLLMENPEDWKWSSARAIRYQEGLLPDDFDIPTLMK